MYLGNGLFLDPATRCKISDEGYEVSPLTHQDDNTFYCGNGGVHLTISGEVERNSCTRHTIPYAKGMATLMP